MSENLEPNEGEMAPPSESEDPSATTDDTTHLSARLNAAECELAELREVVQTLDDKLHAAMAEWTRHREDISHARDEAHREMASAFESFLSQKLQGLAHRAMTGSERYSPERVAQMIAKLSLCYLGSPIIDLRRIRRIIRARKDDDLWVASGRAADHVKKIRFQAKSRRIEYFWDYDCIEGAPVDELLQQVWSTCDPEGAVNFVVTPAYMADGKCYLLQRVYTHPSWQ